MTAAWPLPALLAWLAAWAVHLACRPHVGAAASAVLAALAIAVAAPSLTTSSWRRAMVAVGFPVSFVASGVLSGAVSPWLWLLPLVALACVYPVGAWRDAPLFPTPRGALAGLGAALPLREGARVLDAGCGTGDALRELGHEYPQAALAGVERSWPVALAARLRLRRRATIACGDLWAGDWSALDLLYVFQRPESMPRVAAKALREMRADALLASLEFPIIGVAPIFVGTGTRRLAVYRVGDLEVPRSVRAKDAAGQARYVAQEADPPDPPRPGEVALVGGHEECVGACRATAWSSVSTRWWSGRAASSIAALADVAPSRRPARRR